jgi:hypothetical protein
LRGVLQQVLEALRLSMQVVADDSATTTENAGQVDDEIYRTGGPTNPNSAVGSVKQGVDCRGHMYTDDSEVVVQDNVQRAVVGCWLLVKEGSACMAKLIQLLPAPTMDRNNSGKKKDAQKTEAADLELWPELAAAIQPYLDMAAAWNDSSDSAASVLSSKTVRTHSASHAAATVAHHVASPS